MPHLSKRQVNEKALSSLLKAFVALLKRCRTDKEIAVFLDSILTPTEKIMLAKRLGVIIMLDNGVPDTRIDKALKVTRMTISKIKRIMKGGSRGYELALAKLARLKDWQKIKKNLLQLINP